MMHPGEGDDCKTTMVRSAAMRFAALFLSLPRCLFCRRRCTCCTAELPAADGSCVLPHPSSPCACTQPTASTILAAILMFLARVPAPRCAPSRRLWRASTRRCPPSSSPTGGKIRAVCIMYDKLRVVCIMYALQIRLRGMHAGIPSSCATSCAQCNANNISNQPMVDTDRVIQSSCTWTS